MSLQKKIVTVFLAALFLTAAAAPIAQADTFDQIINGFGTTGEEAGFAVEEGGKPTREFNVAWVRYLNGMVIVMGLLFMVLVIYGGWIWMTAQGNEERVKRGRTLIIQATVGLAIVIGARLIVELTISTIGETVIAS